MDDPVSGGMRALFLVLGSAALGAAYFLYLNAEPFPPDIVRLFPMMWLAGAVAGGVLAARANSNKRLMLFLFLTLKEIGITGINLEVEYGEFDLHSEYINRWIHRGQGWEV